jgi:hypothetical protein
MCHGGSDGSHQSLSFPRQLEKLFPDGIPLPLSPRRRIGGSRSILAVGGACSWWDWSKRDVGQADIVNERRIRGVPCPEDVVDRVKDGLADENLFTMWLVV